ncbi:MAG: MAPEG family protein [Proteobacteria bacterium]|nr:MAPEG family protein [Pseudomonadota bacterium]
MFYKPLLIPLLALVFLTFLVWVYMYVTRVREIKRKSIDPQSLDTRVHSQALLTDSAAQADNLKNLFELPVLFYVAVLLTLVLMIQDQLLVQLVWGYVALRYVHSLVHCTYNRVMHRFIAYAASCLVLMLIWARLAAYVLMH